MTYNVPEFVTKDSCLLPCGKILVDCDCPAPQHPFPEAVDCRREIEEIDAAVQLFCELEWIRCIVSIY